MSVANTIPVLSVAVEVVDLLHKEGSLRFSDIASQLNRPKATVYRILKTLEQNLWIGYEEDTKKYSISLLFLRYYKPFLLDRSVQLFQQLAPKWSDLIKHTLQLAVLDDFYSIFASVYHPKDVSVIPNIYIGKHGKIHATAAGKVFLAYTPTLFARFKTKHHQLEKLANNTITDWDKLSQELENIRQKGYAKTQEEFSNGLSCIAAPVFDATQNVRCVLDICVSESSIPKSKELQLKSHLLDFAQKMENI